ncbi:MAG: NYN domain-containing protein [Phormidesmis sp.]
MKKVNDSANSNGSAQGSSQGTAAEPATYLAKAASQNTPAPNDAATHEASPEGAKLKPKTARKVSSRVSADTADASSSQGKSVGAADRPPEVAVSGQADSNSALNLRDRFTAVIPPAERAKDLPNRAPSFQPMVQDSDRIAIFIDGSNLFYAASHLNIEIDYRRLLATLVRGRRLLRAYFYTGVDPQNEKQRGFLLWLNRHGHRVVSKELAQLPDGSRKANLHVEMAVDMMRIAEYCSALTLLGGDGNLAYALQVLSQRGTSIEVVSLQSMTSDSLIDLADSYTDLADLRDEIKR